MDGSIYQKLMNIQQELKAPKGQKNTYGNYRYRSAEDILEAVKPLLGENGCILTLNDCIVTEGGRVYVQACATIVDVETGAMIKNHAYARESESKKGMDDSQVTGTASSYARKYALNGLFCIDDTKDADTDEFTKRTDFNEKLATKSEKEVFIKMCNERGLEPEDILKSVGWESGKMTKAQHGLALKEIARRDKAGAQA